MSPLLVLTLACLCVVATAQLNEDIMRMLRPYVCGRGCDENCGIGKNNQFCHFCGCDPCKDQRCPPGQTCVVRKRTSMNWRYAECVEAVVTRMIADTTTPTSTTRRARTTPGEENQTPCPDGKLCMFDRECDRGQTCHKTEDTMLGKCCDWKSVHLKPKCRMPKDAGPCRAGLMRWFYNSTSTSCEAFLFGGCNPSPNHFDSEDACKAECESDCIHPRDAGMCRGMFTKYRFNADSGDCEAFWYGGCLGNSNRWDTMDDCEKRCKRRPFK